MMKYAIVFVFFLVPFLIDAQNIQVDTNTYTAQQLIEDILIDSDCITNVEVTNVVGGNFSGADQSYGFFDAAGTSFPFKKGVMLSTGKIQNTQGPNTTLSDDDAPNWDGDSDLETALNESNTTNATIIEFDFTSVANQISFKYIFASEEYQENNSNTCNYSDLFGFLIRPINSAEYTNIALVPNTQTPVKVTTVHPFIPNGCAAQNDIYFESWNDATAPINFNGQTKVLTATAITIPNETYHVKLVIADEQNYRYDSAVFLEAGSFQLSMDLGGDRLISNNNPLCFGEIIEIGESNPASGSTYKWFKNNIEIPLATNSTIMVSEAGTYRLETTLGNNCISYGETMIEYAEELHTTKAYLESCDNDTDGLTFFDLHLADSLFTIDSFSMVPVKNYYVLESDAIQRINPISNTTKFSATLPNQIIFARLENEYGCFAVEPLTLTANYTTSNITSFEVCDVDNDGFAMFNLNELRILLEPEVSQSAEIMFYASYEDAVNHSNQLSDSYTNSAAFIEEIYVIAQTTSCELFTIVTLKVLSPEELLPYEEITFCLDDNNTSFTINAGFLSDTYNENYIIVWEKDGVELELDDFEIEVLETGLYHVIVTNPYGCTSERNIDVTISEVAIVDAIYIEEVNGLNSIEVSTLGDGNYTYALDTIEIFQESNVFLNVIPGDYIIFIKDNKGCETVEVFVEVLETFPKFFTPNNDGYNDTWSPSIEKIGGNLATKIYVFDRFGKMVKEIIPFGLGWDGTFNGVMLPSADYWYKIVLENGKVFNGHFSLKR
ncbi:MAG: T9SS type B sorting domain-containing protein [Lutibacter sp.]|uniref:T9SS type B sorting domain-containing protein n=1 Tax=Lutibacter sp. TaxID=1925666 RepID=UPI0017CA3E93|nr:choice-of-anchor L domain-containing protein [Lutibacter sp.]MBT8317881.1 T9SS type B sorting domain-containing protein [Lutibacter sp.]NNJ58739.1 T9SS type B sorting domain-containing protein [Lutibacter sp.]